MRGEEDSDREGDMEGEEEEEEDDERGVSSPPRSASPSASAAAPLSSSPLPSTTTRRVDVPRPMNVPPPPAAAAAPRLLQPTTLWQRMRSNLQFASDRGLARVAIAAFSIGFFMAIGLLAFAYCLIWRIDWLAKLGLYITIFGCFHSLEFFLTALFHPAQLSYASFLLNHSREYHIAIIGSAVEFTVELLFFPSLKEMTLVSLIGVVLVVAGQGMRTAAMYTAGVSFTHHIAENRATQHQLVTTGVYSICRHPSYCGWFVWCLGTQLLLNNPICFLGYLATSWMFFNERIRYEEELLLEFFREDYAAYKQRVPWSGIPFVA